MNRDVLVFLIMEWLYHFQNNGKLEGCVTAIYPALTDGKSVVTLKQQTAGFRFLFKGYVFRG